MYCPRHFAQRRLTLYNIYDGVSLFSREISLGGSHKFCNIHFDMGRYKNGWKRDIYREKNEKCWGVAEISIRMKLEIWFLLSAVQRDLLYFPYTHSFCHFLSPPPACPPLLSCCFLRSLVAISATQRENATFHLSRCYLSLSPPFCLYSRSYLKANFFFFSPSRAPLTSLTSFHTSLLLLPFLLFIAKMWLCVIFCCFLVFINFNNNNSIY